MNLAWLAVIVVVAAVVTVAWRRRRPLGGPRREEPRRREGTVKRIEAYSFPVLGAVIAVAALVYWERWISIVSLAIAALFVFAGVASFRELRRAREGEA